MPSHANRIDPKLRRHDLAYVSSAAWRSLLETREDLATDPLVVQWVDRGWPLIARRATPGEAGGVPLGLPLPPFAGKRRISLLMQSDDIFSIAPPPQLNACISVAPLPWEHTLREVASLASRHDIEPRVFGSLAWQMLTGLAYLTDSSDLDLLLPVSRSSDLIRLTAELAAIDAMAPMRLDGELVRDDGAGVNWRELHADVDDVLLKTSDGITLQKANLFLSSEIPS